MTTTTSITQTSDNAIAQYVPFGLPASQGTDPIIDDLFSHILSILEPKELGRAERVCNLWRTFIIGTDQWKKQCQFLLNIPPNIDPHTYIPECPSYKKTLQLILSRVFNEDTYRYYLRVNIIPVPIPEGISLKRWKERDPFDGTMVGQTCFWVYYPEYYIKVDSPPCYSNEIEALMGKEEKPGYTICATGLFKDRDGNIKRSLKIPNTLHNNASLIPSFRFYHNDRPIGNCGGKWIPAGWRCIRENAVGKGLDMNERHALLERKGFTTSSLFHRINFIMLRHVSSRKADEYPPAWGVNRRAMLEVEVECTSTPSMQKLLGGVFTYFGCRQDPLGLEIVEFTDQFSGPHIGLVVELEPLSDDKELKINLS